MNQPNANDIWLTASECANRMGLTIRALRLYERFGLLKPKRTQKKRTFASRGVTPQGCDVYEVTYENGKLGWIFALAPDGRFKHTHFQLWL